MSLVKINFKLPDLARIVAENKDEILLFMAANMQTNRALLFDSGGSRNGNTAWAPLKLRDGRPLLDRGNLRRSIAPQGSRGKPGPNGIVNITGTQITIGTKLAYAAMMNWGTTKLPGGVLRPVNAKALKIPLGGRKFMFRKSVKIPARRFDQWTTQDQQEMEVALLNKLIEILNGKN